MDLDAVLSLAPRCAAGGSMEEEGTWGVAARLLLQSILWWAPAGRLLSQVASSLKQAGQIFRR